MDKITLQYIIDQYGDSNMMICGRHNLGEDRISTGSSDTVIITTYWDDKFDPKGKVIPYMKLKDILQNVVDYEIVDEPENNTIIVKYGNKRG